MLFLCPYSERLPLQERELKYCFGIILKSFFPSFTNTTVLFPMGRYQDMVPVLKQPTFGNSKTYIKLAPVTDRRKRVPCLHRVINKMPSGSV